MEILKVEHLNVTYKARKKDNHIVKDVSFSLNRGECLCILGESGSGKSMTMKAIMGLLDHNFLVTGNAYFNQENLFLKSKESLRQIRGKEMSMILQNPMICFDSLYRIDYQMSETFQEHTNWSKSEIYENSMVALKKMKINDPEEVLKKFPHQLSGGMLQRIMIAIALTLDTKILIADEPTTAIDAITQFEIMKEFQHIKENGTTMIFITHDLAVASMISDKIIVMKKGEIVDFGSFADVVKTPNDSYTKLLIKQRKTVMEQYKKVLGGVI